MNPNKPRSLSPHPPPLPHSPQPPPPPPPSSPYSSLHSSPASSPPSSTHSPSPLLPPQHSSQPQTTTPSLQQPVPLHSNLRPGFMNLPSANSPPLVTPLVTSSAPPIMQNTHPSIHPPTHPSALHTPPFPSLSRPDSAHPPTPPDVPVHPSLEPIIMPRELLEHIGQRVELAARAYVRELFKASMDDLD